MHACTQTHTHTHRLHHYSNFGLITSRNSGLSSPIYPAVVEQQLYISSAGLSGGYRKVPTSQVVEWLKWKKWVCKCIAPGDAHSLSYLNTCTPEVRCLGIPRRENCTQAFKCSIWSGKINIFMLWGLCNESVLSLLAFSSLHAYGSQIEIEMWENEMSSKLWRRGLGSTYWF